MFAARDGDVYLLCSDGLTSMIHEVGVRPVLERMTEPRPQAGRELIAAANDAGGRDNITVILFRLEEVDGGAAGAADGDRGDRRARGRRARPAEYDTFEGEAVSPRQGASRPYAHTRVRDEEAMHPERGRERRARRRRAGGGVPRQRHGRAVGDRAARPRRAGRGATRARCRRARRRSPAAPPPPGRPRKRKRRRRIPAGVVVAVVLLAMVLGGVLARDPGGLLRRHRPRPRRHGDDLPGPAGRPPARHRSSTAATRARA